MVTCTGSLLKTIEGLKKMADMLRAAGVNKPGWLLATDGFIKRAVKEGILDI